MLKKKVLFVVNHLTIGGVQKSLISALNALDYEKNDVTLYVRKNRLVLLPYVNKKVHVIINDDTHHYYRLPKTIWIQSQIKIKELLKMEVKYNTKRLNQYVHYKQMEYEEERFFADCVFDIAIAYNEGYTAEFVADRVKAKKKIMLFQSSTDSLHDVHKRILPLFDLIVVEHTDIKSNLHSWYKELDANKIQILENYTDFRFLRKMCGETDLQFSQDVFTLCTCARFSPEKGIDIAVCTASILKNKGLKYLWYLLGDGPEMERISSLVAKYELQDYVKLVGMQTNPYPYMANCDIYVQPSREEALSIAMLESQMLCVPMISTKTAGGFAMIQEGINGLLADINAESLANTIENLLVNEDLRLRIKTYLCSIDYSKEEARYRNDWKSLLE